MVAMALGAPGPVCRLIEDGILSAILLGRTAVCLRHLISRFCVLLAIKIPTGIVDPSIDRKIYRVLAVRGAMR